MPTAGKIKRKVEFLMEKKKKSKEERKRDREIVESYHQKVTEEALEKLFKHFQNWKREDLAYYELTEHIHEFHKLNQKIWSKFNSSGWDEQFLILEAKRELKLLTEEEKDEYKLFLNLD